MFFDRFKKLCDKRGVSVYRACTDIKLNRSAVAKWKNGGKPNGTTAAKLAEYFGVSTDYLLTGMQKGTVTAYSNGICAYTGSTVQDIETKLAERDPASFRVVYRGAGVVITVDAGSAPSCDQINAVIAIYAPEHAQKEKTPTLSKKDERDIAKTMELLMNQLTDDETLMFDGDPMSDEARATIFSAMQLGLEAAKIKNKERFTPKKFKKG